MNMTDRIDARGLACPKPLIETRKVISKTSNDLVEVLVNNETAADNISRMARDLGWSVAASDGPAGEIHIVLGRGKEPAPAQVSAISEEPVAKVRGEPELVVLVASDRMGDGPAELGSDLMQSFIETLLSVSPQPAAVMFINTGVKLSAGDTPVAKELQELADQGAVILSCGKCLDFFDLKELLRVGEVSNMWEIVSLMASADRVLRP